jgi:hypothetical protein
LSLYRAHHREYVAAIADRDGARAEQAMRRHLLMVRENMLASSATRLEAGGIATAPITKPRPATTEKRAGGSG